MKIKKLFICTNCGHNAAKWEGKCPTCNEWNTYNEEDVTPTSKTEKKKEVWKGKGPKIANKPILIQDVIHNETHRLSLPDLEFNRTLGGGLVSTIPSQSPLCLRGGKSTADQDESRTHRHQESAV